MVGRLLCTVLSLVMTAYIMCIIIFFFLHQDIKENVNRLNYDVCEIVSTSGLLSRHTYDRLKYETSRFGSIVIALKLEMQLKPGIYDTYYDEADIVDRKLRVGDRLTICIEDSNTPVFYRLINAQILGSRPLACQELHVRSVKSAVISREAR